MISKIYAAEALVNRPLTPGGASRIIRAMKNGVYSRGRASMLVWIAAAAGSAALIALDQWTKALAAARLAGRGMLSLVDGFAFLVFARNSGAFLSLGAGLPPLLRKLFLIPLPILALGFLGWAFLRRGLGPRHSSDPSGADPRGAGAGPIDLATISLLAAGGIGNLIDRILYDGEVRDFLYFRLGKLHTGIMNLADLCILAALILMVVGTLRGSAGKGKPADKDPPGAGLPD
jgi:signal peptidase II